MTTVWADSKHEQKFEENDGGRSKYFDGTTGDCVTRAIAIASGIDYKEVYDALFGTIKAERKNKRTKLSRKRAGQSGTTPRNGVHRKIYEPYLLANGFRWVPLMHVGSGCTVHLRGDELPKGRIIASLSRHLVAVIDGVVHDIYDPTRAGQRCVYGYYINERPLPVKKVTKKDVVKKATKGMKPLQKLSSWHKEEIVRLIDNRLETIQDDHLSADSFETETSLNFLRDKIENGLVHVFTKEEKTWLKEELSNADSLGTLRAGRLMEYVDLH